ncbi:1-acyl-sn-glycerol-3-phosphate acyltransferase [Kocuria coralli]|uniref:1-acyl-sn-glycerol-3-phosphate acyltransferase n=1 Tax=Kocuria coralli TaxID=1461025 RepID=A0A5J5L070_9MICC|nr:lysophospholipid acyltransferase family protein [Kocuria coralli]KAA9394436.1 1-acyl-sn-glycerol-3-phosphate acyltransferase [Kocuria coralli]
MVYMFLKDWVVTPIVNLVFRPKVVGAENVPASGPAILASNHLSASDHIFMPIAVKRQIFFLAKSDYFVGKSLKGKVVAWFFRAINQIPMDRSGGRKSAASLSAGGRKLAEGELLGIYPEGTRSHDGRLYRGKIGVARLVLETGAPVIPIAMVGTDVVQPLGTAFPAPWRQKNGFRVTTIFGEPMDFSHLRGRTDEREAARQITDEIVHAIQRLSGQEYVEAYAADVKRRLAKKPGRTT